jgi:hypothetical protein
MKVSEAVIGNSCHEFTNSDYLMNPIGKTRLFEMLHATPKAVTSRLRLRNYSKPALVRSVLDSNEHTSAEA